MESSRIRVVAHAGVAAAVYVAVTAVFAPVSFGPMQLRFAEILNLLAFINPVYAVGVTLGCLLSNALFSEFGLWDIIIGTACTGAATFLITKTKRLFVACLWPVVLTLPVSAMLAYLLGLPFLGTAAAVAAGEAVVVIGAGYPLFRYLIIRKQTEM